MSGEPAFFEIGVKDPQRGKAFYGALFGWDFTPGPSAGGGFMIGTPGLSGGMHGGDRGGQQNQQQGCCTPARERS